MEAPLWFSNLVFWSIQAALLILAAGLLARALRLQQPRVLLASWRLLLALCLLLPFVQPWHRPQNGAAIATSNDFGSVLFSPPSAPAAPHWHVPSLQTIAPVIGIVILFGIALRLAALLLGLLNLRRLRQTSFPIASSAETSSVLQAMRVLLAAPAEFRLSSQVDSPVTFGFVAPVVLLPDRFPSLELRFQSAIACHELLHVRRHDWAHHLGEEVLRALFWFHPAIAWLISRVRLAREQVVDLEVVRLTNARKSYLESLLEFANGRSPIAAIPAPPFLAERQLVERVSLMLKEVRMSRRRLIGSLAVISGCLALVVALAAWAFPLKGAPLAAQAPPKADITGGVPGVISGGVKSGVSGGIVGGIEGGVRDDAGKRSSADEPNVDVSTIWTDTVKRGAMPRQVRGMGTLVRAEGSANLVARVILPDEITREVKPNQNAMVSVRNGQPIFQVKGHVSNIGPLSSNGMHAVDIAFDSVELAPGADLPGGVGAGSKIDATIDIGKLDNVLFMGRPVNGRQNSEISLFKISNNGTEAVRTQVKLGRASVSTIEVLDGLQEGDKVIISDTSTVAGADRVRLADEKHLSRH